MKSRTPRALAGASGCDDRRPGNANPFSGEADAAYLAWRDWKLAHAVSVAAAPVVEVKTLARPSAGERQAIRDQCRYRNFAVYATQGLVDKSTIKTFAAAFGLNRLDQTHCTDDDAITELKIATDGRRANYIPYSNQPLSWHTDGYYNGETARIRGFILHCLQPARPGGVSLVMDPDLAYIHLMDREPAMVRALMDRGTMTIPENVEAGRVVRGAETGPVFAVIGGDLHMRYSARQRNILWKDDPHVAAARRTLGALLADETAAPLRFRLQSEQGVVCNNVLHKRTGFEAGSDRLFLRARFLDRVAETSWQDDPAFQPPT